MKQILFILLTVLIMTQGFSQSYKDASEAKGLAVGNKAPLFSAINAEGKIVWRQFDPDYKNQSTVNDILNNLPL